MKALLKNRRSPCLFPAILNIAAISFVLVFIRSSYFPSTSKERTLATVTYTAAELAVMNEGLPSSAEILPRILVGVFSTAQRRQSRDRLRSYYPKVEGVCVMFVVCRNKVEKFNLEVQREALEFEDLIVLDYIDENMNYGKTLEYFRWVYFNRTKWDFVFKTDDDSLFHLKHLQAAFHGFPKTGVYFGSRAWWPGARHLWNYMFV